VILQSLINAQLPHPMKIFMTLIQHICRHLYCAEIGRGEMHSRYFVANSHTKFSNEVKTQCNCVVKRKDVFFISSFVIEMLDWKIMSRLASFDF
jgi:hypothetical protein